MKKRLVKTILTHLILIVVVIIALFPVYFMVLMSFSRIPLATLTANSLVPDLSLLTLGNYAGILANPYIPFYLWLKNSLIFGTSAAVIGVACSATTGFALSRFKFPGRKPLIYIVILVTQFPGVLLILPYYFMLAPYRLTSSYLGLIIPYSAGAVVFTGVLVKNYIDSIPEDIEEAALVDGYGRGGAFVRVTLPLITPILALGVLLAFAGPYSDYALANFFITNPKLWTLALGLYKTSQTTGPGLNYGIFSAFSIIMALPILILFLALQRYIISGLTLGGVKG